MGSRDKDAGDGRCMDLGMGKVVVDARLAWLPAVVYRRGLGMNARAFGEVSGPSFDFAHGNFADFPRVLMLMCDVGCCLCVPPSAGLPFRASKSVLPRLWRSGQPWTFDLRGHTPSKP